MSAIDCRTTARLLGRWYDGDLPPEQSESYEEHLVVCPPCLAENERMRLAIGALVRAAE